MGTQGLVSVVNQDKVVFKIVVGCDGYNAEAFAKCVLTEKPESAYEFTEEQSLKWLDVMADMNDFGCSDCRVVLGASEALWNGQCGKLTREEELSALYRTTFDDPWFNPRWLEGTVSYSFVVDLYAGAVNKNE